MSKKDYRFIDLFAGCGGLSEGFYRDGYKALFHLEIDEAACKTLRTRMKHYGYSDKEIEEAVMCDDITRDGLLKDMDERIHEPVDIIIGGPPCQGFSMKGKKLGLNDPRNFLFMEYLNLVQEIQPEVFVIENVKSLLNTAGGWFKDEILNYIHKLGYKVQYGVLNAKKFGVPQARERAIFICSKHKDITLPKGTESIVTVRDAISDLAYLQSAEGEFEQEYITAQETEYQKFMRKGSKHLYNHKASAHSEKALEKLAMIPAEKGKECLPEELWGKQKFNTTWGRLVWDEVSPTIDTRFDTPSNGTNSHPELNRAITPREAARIQSFDDNFVFYGSKFYIRSQIGNAVPPLLAEAIADRIWEMYRNE